MGCGHSVPSSSKAGSTCPPISHLTVAESDHKDGEQAQEEEDGDSLRRQDSMSVTLPEDLLQLLRKNFDSIAKSLNDDGMIDKKEFFMFLQVEESLFTDRVFDLFDADRSGAISKDEFIRALAILCENGPVEEKIRLSFKLWDLSNKKVITKDDLHRLMVSSVEDSSLLVSPGQMQKLINATFALADLDNNGHITLSEYRKLVDRYPNMISNMTMDILSKFQVMKNENQKQDR